MKPPPEYQPWDASEFEEPPGPALLDTILWFIAGLAVLLAVVAGVLFLADLIWGQG
jgi:hypothetical protein